MCRKLVTVSLAVVESQIKCNLKLADTKERKFKKVDITGQRWIAEKDIIQHIVKIMFVKQVTCN